MIDLVFNDIDGCLGKFKKPRYPDKQDLKGHKSDLGRLRKFVQNHPNVKFAACTGRSLYICDNIIEACAFNEISTVEMGHQIYHPLTGESYSLLGLIKPELASLAEELKEFIKFNDTFKDELKDEFPGSGIIRLKENINMLTYEFKSKEKKNGMTGEELYVFLEKKFPEKIKKGIDQGNVKFVTCNFAIDLRLDINKGDAIDHILGRLKRTGEKCLGIGDSYHSDIDMMERCEYVACPSNSNEPLKDYVNDRKGYIAKEPFGKGVLEIYNRLLNQKL